MPTRQARFRWILRIATISWDSATLRALDGPQRVKLPSARCLILPIHFIGMPRLSNPKYFYRNRGCQLFARSPFSVTCCVRLLLRNSIISIASRRYRIRRSCRVYSAANRQSPPRQCQRRISQTGARRTGLVHVAGRNYRY